MRIFIDPGHGGTDSGAVGQLLHEKTVTLNVSNRVSYHLRRHSQEVVMSRTTDKTMSLSQRTSIENASKFDVAISIHCNAFNGTAKGVETYTYKGTTTQKKLASSVHNSILSSKLYTVDRGLKTANFHMLRETKAVAILVELAFIDNVDDANLLKTKQEEYAIAIAKGILNYLGVSWKDEISNTQTPTPTNNKSLYIVSVGAYSSKENAENMVNELKKKGCNSYIHTCN